jgi:hypothetical protein
LKIGLLLDPAERGHGGDGHLCRVVDLHLQPRLHGEGKALRALLRFPLLVLRRDADGGAANSLLLLFMAWELVGLASYLLIGFYYEKPSAAAAAQKAFITTRIGDMAFFLGMIWLYGTAAPCCFTMAETACSNPAR